MVGKDPGSKEPGLDSAGTEASEAPAWKRPVVIAVAVATACALLVGGAIAYRNRAESLRSERVAELEERSLAGDFGTDPKEDGLSVSQAMTRAPGIMRAGQPLETVKEPPEHTLSYLDPRSTKKDWVWAVLFGVYGYGPDRDGRTTVAGRIFSARPSGKTKTGFVLSNHNVLMAVPNAADLKTLRSGGAFEGTVRLEAARGLYQLVVSDIEHVETP